MTKITRKGMAGSAAILLIFCACFMVGVGLAAAAPSVSVSPQTNEYDAGDTFQISILVDSDVHDLRAVNLQLGYDPAALQVNSITDNNLLGANVLVAPGSGDDGAGTINYGIASTAGVYAPVDGTMLTIEFEVNAEASDGVYDLDLKNVALKNEDNVAIAGVASMDGTVKVGDEVAPPAPAEPEVMITPEMSGPVGPGDTFQVEIEVDSAEENLRAVNLQMGYDPAVLKVNSVTDNQLLGAGALVAPGSGDDGVGTITYGIASTAGPYAPVAGTMLTIEFEVQAGAATGTYGLALDNVVLKDANAADILGVLVTGASVQVVQPGDGPVTVPEVMISPVSSGPYDIGDTFQIEVDVTSGDYNLRAISIQMNYDETALQVNSITNNDLLGAGALVAPDSGYYNDAGIILYGIASTGDYTPKAGSMLTIEFEVKAGAVDGIYDLALNNVVLRDEANVNIPGVVVTDGTVEVSTVPNVVPEPEIISHADGDVVSKTQIVEVVDNSGQDDIIKATFEVFADINENCMDDDVGQVWTVFGTDEEGSDGWTAALDTTTVPDGQYLIRATLYDGKDSAFHTICVRVYNPEGIMLLPGWNLISFPETLENPDIDHVLQDYDDTQIDAVFYYDASSGMMVVPDSFEPLKAYWIHNNMEAEVVINEDYLTAKVPSTPPSLRLYPGWNAIGHNAQVDLSADIALKTIDSSYDKITGPWVASAGEHAYVGYNGVEGVVNANHVGTDVFKMNVYEGYFVYVTKECVYA